MWLTVPNLFTFLRVLMTPFILVELAHGEYLISGWMFGAAAFTDFLDGAAARRFGAESKLGLYLDPIADKILLSSMYVGLAIAQAVPTWLVVVIFARDLWIVLLSGIALRFTKFRQLNPSMWGKVSTVAQIALVGCVMAGHAYGIEIYLRIAEVLVWCVLGLAVLSGGEYSWRGIDYLRQRGAGLG